MHSSVLLKLVHWDSILHSIHCLGISQPERISIDSVDEFHWVDEFEPINQTTERLFAKPSI